MKTPMLRRLLPKICGLALWLLSLTSFPAWATTVRMQTSLGAIDIQLMDATAPATVANFLRYVQSGAYVDSFFHRSVPGFIVQGGGFQWNSASNGYLSVATSAPVVNEFSPSRSNLRGTLAMAKLGNDPNSATSQWFFNLADNSGNLDSQNGGFTVFGAVIGNGMQVVDAIAGLATVNAGGAFGSLPVLVQPTGAISTQNLVLIRAVEVLSAVPVCTLSASPVSVAVGESSTLTASCSPAATAYRWSGAGCVGVTGPSCAVTPAATSTYTVTGSNSLGAGSPATASVTVTASPATTPQTPYMGLWWNPNESGWGISLTQHVDSSANTNKIFAAIYTYDAAGLPTWYVMSDCPVTANSCMGDLYKVTGGSTPLVSWNGTVKPVAEGKGSLSFTDASHGKFDYTLNGVTRSKSLEKFQFANGTAAFAVDYTDLWWKDGESGWGVALTQDKGMIFAAWYAYDDQGKPVWYTASSCPLSGVTSTGRCTAALYQVTGGAPLTATWDTARPVSATEVGTVTFEFADANKGLMTYLLNGKAASRTITRFGF